MDDAFVLLDEPRRPWVDTEALRQKFLALSSAVHPDRVHSAESAEKKAATVKYAALNAAYNVLKEPKDRLLHLLELETGTPPRDIQRIPPGTMVLFVDVGQTCREVDQFLTEKAAASSPMVKLKLFERGMDWTDRLGQLQQRINGRRDELFDELRQMNSLWEMAPAVGDGTRAAKLPLERLEQIYRVLSYVSRWTGQIQERVVQLAV